MLNTKHIHMQYKVCVHVCVCAGQSITLNRTFDMYKITHYHSVSFSLCMSPSILFLLTVGS